MPRRTLISLDSLGEFPDREQTYIADGANMHNIVQDALNTLPRRQQLVVLSKHGFLEPDQTLSAIGRRLGLSRERVRQVLKDAYHKLRGQLSNQLPFQYAAKPGISALIQEKRIEMLSRRYA